MCDVLINEEHESIKKRKAVEHTCDVCQKTFLHKGNLTRHKNSTHLGMKNHACDECEMLFAQKSDLTRHMNSTHLGMKLHKCPECGKLFTQLAHLKTHLDRHEISKSWKFVCSFAEGKIHTEDGSSDGILCGVRCRTQWILDYHVQASHTDEGLSSKYKSEAKLAAFLDSKGVDYDQDRMNHVSLMCKPGLNLTGSRCFPDFFLLWLSAKLRANAILGNDENGHRRYPCDLRRTLEMATSISAASDNYGMKLLYVRFNPHFYTVDGVVRDRPLAALHEEMWKVLEGLTAESLIHNGLNLIYINYDQISAPATENKPTELWRRLQLFTHLDAHPDDENSEMALLLRDLVIGVY